MRLERIICPAGAAEAVAAEARAALGDDPHWIWVQFSAGVAGDALRDALARVFPRTALHGASSCLGAMANGGAGIGPAGAVGLLALRDDDGAFGTAAAAFGEDPAEVARAAAMAACAAAGRPGEAPELVWLSAVPGCEEQVIAGIEAALGRETPIYGGSAADDAVRGDWSVFDAGQHLSDGLVVSVLFPSGRVGHAFQSGYAPVGPGATVTAAAGRRLIALDGRPARQVYDDWTGGAVVAGPAEAAAPILAASTWSPLGRADATVAEIPFHLLLHPARAEADGALTLFADVAEGDRLHLMAGGSDSLTARAARTASLAMEAGGFTAAEAAGALVIFCGGSMLAMQPAMDEVARRIDAALGGAPFLGGFSFGEQGVALSGRNRHGNLMISVVVFARC